MTTTIIITLLLLTLYLLYNLRLTKKELARLVTELDQERELFKQCEIRAGGSSAAFDEFNRQNREIIQKRKDQILVSLSQKKLSSAAVADLLEVSQRTARRYLQELIEAEKVVQVGSFGPSVRYSLGGNSKDEKGDKL